MRLTGNYYYGARYYDPKLSVFLSVDPLVEKTMTAYAYCNNNPINFVDSTGMIAEPPKEYPWYYMGTLGRSDWRSSDRLLNTPRWKSANKYNLQQNKGFLEYSTISQRTAFYKWFQLDIESRGYETKWAGAAFMIAAQMEGTENRFFSTIVMMTDEIKQFAQDANKAIFDDVFSELKALYNGRVLKGDAARIWDEDILTNEQLNIVEPIYRKQTLETLGTLSKMAKGEGVYDNGVAEWVKFDSKGDVLDWTQRFNHGLNKAVPGWEKYKNPTRLERSGPFIK